MLLCPGCLVVPLSWCLLLAPVSCPVEPKVTVRKCRLEVVACASSWLCRPQSCQDQVHDKKGRKGVALGSAVRYRQGAAGCPVLLPGFRLVL